MQKHMKFCALNHSTSLHSGTYTVLYHPVLWYVRTGWTVGTTIAQIYTVGRTVLYHHVLWYVRTGWTVWITIGGVQYTVGHSISCPVVHEDEMHLYQADYSMVIGQKHRAGHFEIFWDWFGHLLAILDMFAHPAATQYMPSELC